MMYHELRVLVPGGPDNAPIGGVVMIDVVHDALTPVIAERLGDETAPVIVTWERMVPVAASGAL